MKNLINAKGLPCPEPVILAKKAIEQYEEFTIIVNEQEARENVTSMAESMGCKVAFDRRGVEFYLTITRQAKPVDAPAPSCTAASTGPTVLVLSSDKMGRGNDDLGALLMKSFIHTLTEVADKPRTIILFNTGARLAVEGSDVIPDLKGLADKGVKIIVCGTCLGFFEAKDKLRVGTVSNMYDITETMMAAGKLIQP